MHAFERVHTLVLQTDVCGLAEYLHAQPKSLRGSHSKSPRS